MNRLVEFIKSKDPKILKLIAIITVIAVIPLTVFLAQKQQELRQRASELPATPPLPPAVVSLKLSPAELTISPETNIEIALSVVPGQNRITGVDLTLTYNKEVINMTSFSPNATSLNNQLMAEIKDGIFHFTATNTQQDLLNQPDQEVPLGKLTFVAKSQGRGKIEFQNIQVTALGYDGALSTVNNSVGVYTVASITPTSLPTSTPVPTATPLPTSTPTITPTPQPPTPTTTVKPGDANGDSNVDILDYNIWRDEFLGILNTKKADFNRDGKVTMLDFAIWRNAVYNPSPTSSPSSTLNSWQSYFGKAVKITGNQGVTIDGKTLPNNQEFTIEGWFKWNDNSRIGDHTLIFKREKKNSPYNASFDITATNYNFEGKDLLGRVLGSGSEVIHAGNVLGDRQWHHIALVTAPTRQTQYGTYYKTQIYVDGKLAATQRFDHIPINYGDGDFYIGWFPSDPNKVNTLPFIGEIDEVKLSNVARYKSDFNPPINPWSPDNNTVGLWHMDGNFQDASGHNYNGQGLNTLQFVDSAVQPVGGGGQQPIFPLPGFSNAVLFQKGSFVQASNTGSIGKFQNATLEAWVNLSGDGELHPIISKKGGYAYSFDVTPERKLKFTYSIFYADHWAPVEITSDSTIPLNTWTHVATSYFTGGYIGFPSDSMRNSISLYINEQMVAKKDQTGEIGGGSSGDVLIGTDPNQSYSFKGAIDEVRISSSAKYIQGTMISPFKSPFGVGQDTLLLCHFDEGRGNPTCTSNSSPQINTNSSSITYLKN